MRGQLLACLVLVSAAQAQEIECPKFYPWQDTALTEVPYGHAGKGVVKKRELSGAAVMVDDFNMPGDLHGGDQRKVPGGVDIQFPADATYFVCYYGDRTIAWWEKLKHDPKKVKGCTLKMRDKVGRDPMNIRFVCS